jgi:hypothetical protein
MSAYPDFATHPASFGGLAPGLAPAPAPAHATKPATAKP